MLMNDGRQEEIGGRIVLVMSGLLCWTEPEVFPESIIEAYFADSRSLDVAVLSH